LLVEFGGFMADLDKWKLVYSYSSSPLVGSKKEVLRKLFNPNAWLLYFLTLKYKQHYQISKKKYSQIEFDAFDNIWAKFEGDEVTHLIATSNAPTEEEVTKSQRFIHRKKDEIVIGALMFSSLVSSLLLFPVSLTSANELIGMGIASAIFAILGGIYYGFVNKLLNHRRRLENLNLLNGIIDKQETSFSHIAFDLFKISSGASLNFDEDISLFSELSKKFNKSICFLTAANQLSESTPIQSKGFTIEELYGLPPAPTGLADRIHPDTIQPDNFSGKPPAPAPEGGTELNEVNPPNDASPPGQKPDIPPDRPGI